MSQVPDVQKIQDGQGYLILGVTRKYKVGQVLGGGINLPKHEPNRLEYLVVVIGESSYPAFSLQAARWNLPPASCYPHYVRVVMLQE